MTARLMADGLTFDKPDDIVTSELIDRRDKIKRLENWKSRVIHRLDSTNEGMRPNGTTDVDMKLLESLDRALTALDHLSTPTGPNWRERETEAAERDAAGSRDAACPRG